MMRMGRDGNMRRLERFNEGEKRRGRLKGGKGKGGRGGERRLRAGDMGRK